MGPSAPQPRPEIEGAAELGQSGFDAKAADRWRDYISPWINAWFRFWFRGPLKQFGYIS